MVDYDYRAKQISLIEGCIGTLDSIEWSKVSDEDLEKLQSYCIWAESQKKGKELIK
jgi:hypothetical protein